jgi:Bacterial membrane protein YfhO
LRAEERRRAAGVVGVALAATCVFFHRALLGGEVFFARDMLLVYYPLRAYWAQRLLSGSFPDWYPYDGLGQPFVGMAISAVFHPLNLLYLVLPLKAALNLNVLLCFPAAFGGVYRLARRFGATVPPAVLGGLLFAFSGSLVSCTNNLLYLMAAATVPWALWSADRFLERPCWPRASLAGGLAALVLLAGDVQAFALTLCLFAVVAFCRRARVRTLGMLWASALLAGLVQLIPSWQVLGQARQGGQSLSQATLWSTHPLRLLDVLFGPLFAPDATEALGRAFARRLLDAGQGTLWMDSLYVGVPAVVLALLGAWVERKSRTGRAVMLSSALLVLAALGKRGGLSALGYHLIPFFRAFRYPEKWMPYVTLAVALGAVAGLQAVLEMPALRRRAGLLLGVTGVLCLVLAGEEGWLAGLGRWMAGRVGSAGLLLEATAHLAGTLSRMAAISGALALLLAAALLWARRPALVAWAAPACCFLGLLWLNEPRYQLASPEVVDTPSPFLRGVTGTAFRVLHLSGTHLEAAGSQLQATDRHALWSVAALEPVTPALFLVEGANTYLPAGSARVFQLSDDERAWATSRAGLFSSRYLSLAQGNAAALLASGKHLVETLPSFGYVLLDDAEALPRAYVARPLCVQGATESLAAVTSGRFVPGREAIVECEAPLPTSADASGEVTSMVWAPENVVLKVRASAPAVVVLNDAFYSGWRATLDGVETPILAANHAVRAVPVPAGNHEVIFRYRTPGLLVGLAVSLLFLLGGAVAKAVRRSAGPPFPAGLSVHAEDAVPRAETARLTQRR